MTSPPGTLNRRSAITLAAGGFASFGLAASTAESSGRLANSPEFRQGYREGAAGTFEPEVLRRRSGDPVWLDRDGRLSTPGLYVVDRLRRASDDGLDRARYPAAEWGAVVGRPAASAREAGRLEGAMTASFARFVADLHRPAPSNDLTWTDEAFLPERPDPSRVLSDLDEERDLPKVVSSLLMMHPCYEALAGCMAELNAGRMAAPSSLSKVDLHRRLSLNLDRLRALPGEPSRRHIFVNSASATLHAFEGRREVRSMRVIVGRKAHPTPTMAGAIRYAVLKPYWNIPHDLVRDEIAPAVLKDGKGVLAARGLEALSDWSNQARVLSPSEVDWADVAAGGRRLRVRQTPGPGNMMGKVKFMMPNELGIYLHDTPDRGSFARSERNLSAGCVRVEDPDWLARWLFGLGLSDLADGREEQRVDVPEPTPVFLVYQTLTPDLSGSLRAWPDAYGLDEPLAPMT